MSETSTSDDSASSDSAPEGVPDQQRRGPMVFGALLVAIGIALLAAQAGALPAGWRTSLWPILMMLYGAVRMLQVTRRGREGFFFVVAGAWWLAGLQGWLSLPRTWPVLIVGLGASVVVQAFTAPPRIAGVPHQFGRRRSGAHSWVLLAILAGAVISADRHDAMAWLTSTDGKGVITVGGHSTREVEGTGWTEGDIVTVMGRSDLDLTRATVGQDETITVNVMTLMGNSTIRVPDSWTVEIKAAAAFGRVRDNREYLRDPEPDDWSAARSTSNGGPRLVVDGLVMMGSLLITS
jgi:hypothetical protein